MWCWQPIPEGKDHYPETSSQSLELPHGFKLVAARVRGKKHKHEGSHCDDWFELGHSGAWSIIAVADGAGSRLFSRVGARMACEAAVRYLTSQLATHQLTTREQWTTETFARDEHYRFKSPDLEFTQQLLHDAMQIAYVAVEQAWHERDESKYYYKALGNRDLTINDLATTLLLVVHTTVTVNTVVYSLILSCQIGDGVAAAIYKNKPETSVLTELEQNNFSGETLFLTTSPNYLERDYLATKTFPFFSPLRALLVMTDGVADDYFPPPPEMLRLWGNLLLNGIITLTNLAPPAETEILARQDEYMALVERILPTGVVPTPLAMIEDYATLRQQSISELITTPALITAGIPAAILANDITPAERLQLWLDTYQLRGSFDDRTLVVLYHDET